MKAADIGTMNLVKAEVDAIDETGIAFEVERNVFAEVKDGFGNISDTAYTNFFYALYRKIAEINESKEIVQYKYIVKPDAIMTDRITGVFVSPILYVREDLGFWKQLLWKETKPENTEIIICVRSANSIAELQVLPWDNCFASDSSDYGYIATDYILRSLDNIGLKGKYIQFKVTMITDSNNVTPIVAKVGITYSTKFAVYFFTTAFSLEKNARTKSGFMVANITRPQNTEIRFGISGQESRDWNDYTSVDFNKYFDMNNLERVKVGIKMISYDDNIPEVANFAFMTGATGNNMFNQ